MNVIAEDTPETEREDADFRLHANDVTGTVSLDARDIQPSAPAGMIAEAMASRMQLPSNVPWMLRSDRTGAFLEEDQPIGDQIETGSRVVVTPKTHLG